MQVFRAPSGRRVAFNAGPAGLKTARIWLWTRLRAVCAPFCAPETAAFVQSCAPGAGSRARQASRAPVHSCPESSGSACDCYWWPPCRWFTALDARGGCATRTRVAHNPSPVELPQPAHQLPPRRPLQSMHSHASHWPPDTSRITSTRIPGGVPRRGGAARVVAVRLVEHRRRSAPPTDKAA
jgi:hypothetical protein